MSIMTKKFKVQKTGGSQYSCNIYTTAAEAGDNFLRLNVDGTDGYVTLDTSNEKYGTPMRVRKGSTDFYVLTQAKPKYKEWTITPSNYTSYSGYSNFVNGSGFTVSGSNFISGSGSYNISNGTSYGYIAFKTPAEINTSWTITIKCCTSAEMNYDVGIAYIGTQIYKPTNSQCRSKTADGYGAYIYNSYGTSASTSVSTYTYSYSNLKANTQYYLSFAYTKDGSVNSGSDRFFIQSISFIASE